MINILIFGFLFLFFPSKMVAADFFLQGSIPVDPYLIAARSDPYLDLELLQQLQLQNYVMYEAIVNKFQLLVSTKDPIEYSLLLSEYNQAVANYEQFGLTLTEEQLYGFKMVRFDLTQDFRFPVAIPVVCSPMEECFLLNKLVLRFLEYNRFDIRFFSESSPLVPLSKSFVSWSKKRDFFLFCCACCGLYCLKAAVAI